MKTTNILKTQAFSVLLLLLFVAVQAQDYSTIRVNGTIVIERNNTQLETGTTFEEEDSLLFKTHNSIATVINPQKGRFILRPDNTDLAYAKASFTPAMSNISSRSGAFMTALDLKNHLNGKYVFFDEMLLQISPDIFPMNEDKYFFLRYEYEGDTVNKKLTFNEDTLFINKSDVFSIDGEPIDPNSTENFELWYMQRDEGNKITLISNIEPIIVNNEELKKEISIIFEVFTNKTKKELKNEAFSFIHEFYGTSNQENFDNWMIKHMD